MAGNTIGKILTLTSFGESHGKGVGGVLDGFPAGIPIDTNFIGIQLLKRRSGGKAGTSARNEADQVEFLSGLSQGKSTGAPIAFWLANQDVNHTSFQEGVFKPSHAAYTYWRKYGFFDYDGGGRASARETAVRVVGGALAQLLLLREKVTVHAYTRQVGSVRLETDYQEIHLEKIGQNSLFCPDEECNRRMEEYLMRIQAENNSCGAVVGCVATNVPYGLGEPVYNKLHADLAQAVMGINAAKGFEMGAGFRAAGMNGSDYNDLFSANHRLQSNRDGGIQGGISNGENICFSVAFKPVPGIMRPQESCNEKGEEVWLQPSGRNDCCVVPRVIPVVEAMAALVLADHLLMYKTYQNYSYQQ